MIRSSILIALLACAGLTSAQEAVPSVSSNETAADSAAISAVAVQPSIPHFGYISYDRVMHSMPEYTQALKSLEELKQSYESEMQRAEADFTKKFGEYLEGQKTFPENIMLKRQKELQMLMEQSLKFKAEAEAALSKAEQELMAPIHKALQDAISAVGKNRGYAYVVNTDANAYPYISDQGEDCTDAVLTQLDIKP